MGFGLRSKAKAEVLKKFGLRPKAEAEGAIKNLKNFTSFHKLSLDKRILKIGQNLKEIEMNRVF